MNSSTDMMAPKYVIVSPVKDEKQYIECTIQSVLRQTIRPSQWIIVDDGSCDGTSEILKAYCKEIDWMDVIRLDREAKRQPGSAVIHAFNRGLGLIKDKCVDFIVKLDCDVSFGPEYFERIFSKFHEDDTLGIASGVYLEDQGNGPFPVEMPDYHAAGASKVIRARCFSAIGGFISEKGWDTVDEIRAHARGWKTGHFKEVAFSHLKREGSGIGNLRTNRMHGEIYYLTGGSKLFFLFKLAHRMLFGSPRIVGGLMMLAGYLIPLVRGRELLVDEREALVYKKLLNKRIVDRVRIPFFRKDEALQ